MSDKGIMGAQWLTGCLEIDKLRVRASPASLRCVLEPDTLIRPCGFRQEFFLYFPYIKPMNNM